MDNEKSFRNAEKYLESQVRSGGLSREEAHRIHRDAKENYRNDNYGREKERYERTTGKRIKE
jgi:hypothetical protein